MKGMVIGKLPPVKLTAPSPGRLLRFPSGLGFGLGLRF